jgi:hypothetical protein
MRSCCSGSCSSENRVGAAKARAWEPVRRAPGTRVASNRARACDGRRRLDRWDSSSLRSMRPARAPISWGLRHRARIVEEAQALCHVEHPSIVRFCALPEDDAHGVMSVAMECVAAAPLDRRLAEAGRLSVVETLVLGTMMASALSAVHRAGLVHRDVKRRFARAAPRCSSPRCVGGRGGSRPVRRRHLCHHDAWVGRGREDDVDQERG